MEGYVNWEKLKNADVKYLWEVVLVGMVQCLDKHMEDVSVDGIDSVFLRQKEKCTCSVDTIT
jgi:hypothetical protein